MNGVLKTIAALILSAGLMVGCDSSFTGSGGGLGGSQPFKGGDGNPNNRNSGDQNGNFGPNGPGGPGNFGDPNGNFGDGGNNGDGGLLGGGTGGDDTVFSDAIITVTRADGSGKGEYNHRDVQIELKVGNKTTGKVAIGSKGATATLEGVCTTGKPVQFSLFIYHKGQTIRPNKSPVGGILFYRSSKSSIMGGYEYHALNKPGEDSGPDRNDDLMFTMNCVTSVDDQGQEVEMNLGSNSCFMTTINTAGWLSPTKSAGPKTRSCNGT